MSKQCPLCGCYWDKNIQTTFFLRLLLRHEHPNNILCEAIKRTFNFFFVSKCNNCVTVICEWHLSHDGIETQQNEGRLKQNLKKKYSINGKNLFYYVRNHLGALKFILSTMYAYETIFVCCLPAEMQMAVDWKSKK